MHSRRGECVKTIQMYKKCHPDPDSEVVLDSFFCHFEEVPKEK